MIPDHALVMDALKGDEQMLNALFNRHRPYAYTVALKICGYSHIAEDAVQDAFIMAYTKLHQLKDPAAFGSWLKRIVANCCYHALRKEKYALPGEAYYKSEKMLEQAIEQRYENSALRDGLYHALSLLPAALRCTVLLRYLSDFNSYQQIAEILSIPVGTVRSRLNEGRRKLAELWHRAQYASEMEYSNALYWDGFYSKVLPGIYEDGNINTFTRHLDPDVQLVFTDGHSARGKQRIEKSFYDDFEHGSRMKIVDQCISSGTITVLHILFSNAVEYPDHCPSSGFFILRRHKDKLAAMHFHHASCRKQCPPQFP